MKRIATVLLLPLYTCACVLLTRYFCESGQHKNEDSVVLISKSIDKSFLQTLKTLAPSEREQRLEEGRQVFYWLLQELYFRGDKYGYSYDETEIEALILDIYRRESNWVVQEAKKSDGHVPRYFQRHLRSFAGGVPFCETGKDSGVMADFELFKMTLRKFKQVDQVGYDKFVNLNQANTSIRQAAEIIYNEK